MKRAALGIALGSFLLSGWARAAEDDWDGEYGQRAERRSGFAASIGLGFGLGAARGYPNEAAKIDDPDYRTSLGGEFSGMNSLWIGGAIQDWFTFGIGLTGFGARSGDDIELQSGAYVVHIEFFPLWSLGGRFRDLATYVNFGPGSLTIDGGPEKADGGLVSYMGFGSSFELFRWGYFALGPTLEGAYVYSQSARGGGVFLGVRTVFYGGP